MFCVYLRFEKVHLPFLKFESTQIILDEWRFCNMHMKGDIQNYDKGIGAFYVTFM